MFKKNFIAFSIAACLAIPSFSADIDTKTLAAQLEALKAQIANLEARLKESETKATTSEATEKRIQKLEKTVSRNKDTITEVKKHDSNDNLKFDVDFRTSIDNITYKHVDGSKSKNNALMTNRLWLGMGYAPNENTIFKGKLSYLKAYGDSANHSQSNTNPGYANFDWVTNENATDNTLKVKEAYWLYKDSKLFGADVPWTVSVGRRPSTDGIGINAREDMQPNSPLSHTVNVEFDGASAKFDLDKITGVSGMWLKFCGGRGLTNAKPRFQFDGTDYSEDETKNPDVDMIGFIFTPYDDGQYKIMTNYAYATNLIGYSQAELNTYNQAMQTATTASAQMDAFGALSFDDVGDMELFTVLFKVDGIGDGINDYLDDTSVFASYAMSRTHPNQHGMLGSTDSEIGHSFWLGASAPCPLNMEDARIGIEWNKGTKYWRSFTYGEDTMAGSKIAARGNAYEIYRNSKINEALSWSLRYTYIDYDYTGSNSFFGAEGTPYAMNSNEAAASNAVESAQDIRAYIRYRF